jgi:hypothetical protein
MAMMTAASESSEESLHWAQCQNCNSVGPFATYCTECEDQGYVYVEPIRSQDEEGPDPYELDLNKSKEYWNVFFSNLGYLPAEKIVQIKAAFLERATEDEQGLYCIDEIISDSPWWMQCHDEMFPENKLEAHEKHEILQAAVHRLREEAIDKHMQILQRKREAQGVGDDSRLAA